MLLTLKKISQNVTEVITKPTKSKEFYQIREDRDFLGLRGNELTIFSLKNFL